MTAIEYLKKHLSDSWPEATSVYTQTALAAYAIRMYKGVDGYSISDAEKILIECKIKDKIFIKRCTDFLSNSVAFLAYQKRIPNLED